MRFADVPYPQANIRMLDKHPTDHLTDLSCLQLIDRGGSTFRNPRPVVADLRPNVAPLMHTRWLSFAKKVFG
jgi:hypothetical protein